MRFLLTFLAVLFFVNPLFALVGTYVDPAVVAPQLCRILPTSGSSGLAVEKLCSGIIVGKRSLLTAGHCLAIPYEAGRVDCVGGETSLTFQMKNVRFPDPNMILSPFRKTEEGDHLHQDLALITVDQDFSTVPMQVAHPSFQGEIFSSLSEGKCFFAGVGYTDQGALGVGHGVTLPSSLEVRPLEDKRPLYLSGSTYVMAHDSGGGMICPSSQGLVLAGTLVAQKVITQARQGQSANVASFVAPLFTTENWQWLLGGIGDQVQREDDAPLRLLPCEATRSSFASDKLFESALVHLSHFDEIRHLLRIFRKKQYEVCGSGIPLENDMSKNYRYFSNIKVFDQGKLLFRFPLLYTSPSVQADHGIAKRPWVFLPQAEVAEVERELYQNFEANHEVLLSPSASIQGGLVHLKTLKWWSPAIEETFQVMQIGRDPDWDYFAGSWLKLENPQATLYAQFYVPKIVIFRISSKSQMMEVGLPGSSFGTLLAPLTQILDIVSKKAKPMTLDEKVLFIQKLGRPL